MKDYDAQTGGRFVVAPNIVESLPDARGITWDDDFFENSDSESGTIAVFDFDYALISNFTTSVRIISNTVLTSAVTLYIITMTGFAVDAVYPVLCLALSWYVLTVSMTGMQVRWSVYAQHLAVTRDGIRFVNDKQKSCWGLPMCDKGRNSKTVPFDKITDCDIDEPAGNTWCCVRNVLSTVNVDTASSGSDSHRHELSIIGLKDPHAFKRIVWAMKRAKEAGGTFSYHAPPLSGGSEAAPGTAVQMASMLSRGADSGVARELEAGCPGTDVGEIPGLLQEIRDELRQNNELLRQQRGNDHSGIV